MTIALKHKWVQLDATTFLSRGWTRLYKAKYVRESTKPKQGGKLKNSCRKQQKKASPNMMVIWVKMKKKSITFWVIKYIIFFRIICSWTGIVLCQEQGVFFFVLGCEEWNCWIKLLLVFQCNWWREENADDEQLQLNEMPN